MTQKILEVLIPTYRRPRAAIGAIDSVLAGENQRVAVACHSNGADPELEFAATQRSGVRYGCFSENRGAVANFRKLLEDSRADYVLFLSDEDRIDPAHLAGFVDFLSGNRHGFVFCNVVESNGSKYFSVTELQDETMSLEDLLVLFPIHPTYMSGYCFRRDLLTADAIRDAFEIHDSNVYPHLLLRNSIAGRASIGLFSGNIVVKGEEANVGGDSHTHLEKSISATQARQPLNPRIYGESARARQFYYLAPKLNKELNQLSVLRRAFVRLYVLSAWLKITSDAHMYVEATATAPTLEGTIDEYQRKNTHAPNLIRFYNRILSIRQNTVKTAVVTVMWKLSKALKLALFIRRFGMARTLAFVTGKPV